MSEIQELQDEEREALISIYEGDEAFKQVNPTTYQYKYGEENNHRSFLVEISWGPEYPNLVPALNLETFYNRNIIASVKEGITAALSTEAEQWLGCGMTYTLFECLKEKQDELLAEQPEHPTGQDVRGGADVVRSAADDLAGAAKVVVKKEQLTKSQKRRQWEQSDHSGNKPRGYNWVDIVKHLSQTGGKDDSGSVPTNYDG